MENRIFAFFIRTQGEAFAVISTSSYEDWANTLKKLFSINEAEVTISKEDEWVTDELKSETIEELEKKWPKTRMVIYEKLKEKGVPAAALEDIKDKIKIIPNPISGLVVFAYHYSGSLFKKAVPSKEELQIEFLNAVDAGDLDLAGNLISMGADVNAITGKGFHPLWVPMMKKKTDINMIKLLIDKGADVNYKGKGNGMTALFAAVNFGFIEVAKLLLDAGANINEKDNKGSTALLYAQKSGNSSMIKLLQSYEKEKKGFFNIGKWFKK